jgi:hypothetical protein
MKSKNALRSVIRQNHVVAGGLFTTDNTDCTDGNVFIRALRVIRGSFIGWGFAARWPFMAVVLHFGVLAGSAQTNIYLFSGSMTNITLNPGTYIITAYGAPGGGSLEHVSYGGLGAEMSGEFNLSTSTNLTLLVGGGGGINAYVYTGGGGGGSFVVESNTPLVIAGGGGGAGFEGGSGEGGSGTVSTNGGNGGLARHILGVGYGYGGTGGGGGDGGDVSYGYSGGGGGFLGNGGGTNDYVFVGGFSFENGGAGGNGGTGGYSGGGFGGGGGGFTVNNAGGTFAGGGGGGGYSGGGGGSYDGDSGGGGGSIIDSSAITILTEVSGIASPDDPANFFNTGNGEIIITAVPTPLVITPHAAIGFTNGAFGFDVIGPSGSNVVIQASADLQTWIPLQTNLLGSGPLYFSDPQPTTNVQRFYRVQLSP